MSAQIINDFELQGGNNTDGCEEFELSVGNVQEFYDALRVLENHVKQGHKVLVEGCNQEDEIQPNRPASTWHFVIKNA